MDYTTGRSEYWKANNIYDLAGNTWEWTQELYGSIEDTVVLGGSYESESYYDPVSEHENNIRGEREITSFRVQLYINV